MKRVIRIISYEGNPEWVDATLRAPGSPFRTPPGKWGDTVVFDRKGTIKELHRIELLEDESFAGALQRVLGWHIEE